jgi:CheY-like chemotaxis protein
MRNQSFCVVLVEDNPADVEILRTALDQEDAEIEITRFATGWAFLSYFGIGSLPPSDGSSCCDLILLDLNLPEINGFEILERVRDTGSLKTVPIVVMSGSGNPEDIARSYQLGAASYIRKPSHLGDIFAVAHQIVGMLRDHG